MPRGAAGNRTSFGHHPVQHAQAFFVAGFLDHLALSGADRVPDPHRLLRCIKTFELVFVVHEDFLEAARMEPTNGAGPAISDRRKVPAVPEVAADFRLPDMEASPSPSVSLWASFPFSEARVLLPRVRLSWPPPSR